MADGEADEDLFADLYDADDAEPEPTPVKTDTEPAADDEIKQEPVIAGGSTTGPSADNDNSQYKQEYTDDIKQESGHDNMQGMQDYGQSHREERPIGIKEDGKMFIGGLNWETTDESLKDYFSQFGEVVECTVMRDGQTGRSRGFGFLTFRDAKTVNTVMVKEHSLDGKLIDPKRAIPRDEQERTAKIFVGGVSQEATETDFKEFFMKFGRVLDATLMMDKDTGRPRGFGFVTFDSDMAVERTLEGPLAILNKPIEVKRAQPRGKMGEEENNRGFGRGRGMNQQFGPGNGGGGFGANQMQQNNGGGGDPSNMTPAMMAQYWQRMQQYFAVMSNNMGGGMGPMMGGAMNPQMMQQMMMARQNGQMNPQMMQQMQQMQQMQGGQMQGGRGGNGYQQGMNGSPSPMDNNNGQGTPGANEGGNSAYEQMKFEQQKYEQQQMARMQQQNFGGQNTWEGMYDDVPAPQGMGPGMGGGRGGGGFRGGRGGGGKFQNQAPPNAPANAPTGPKNAGRPGANYRGGGRGSHNGGFHPYRRGNS